MSPCEATRRVMPGLRALWMDTFYSFILSSLAGSYRLGTQVLIEWKLPMITIRRE